jgi:hypothetical protein
MQQVKFDTTIDTQPSTEYDKTAFMQLPVDTHPSTQCDELTLMQLPMDLILEISDYFLDPISALALSLTCKGMSEAIFARALPRLGKSDLEGFLLLLEKDTSHQRPTYYCHTCIRLHAFDPADENPSTPSYRITHGTGCRSNRLCLSDLDLAMGYPHGRLIMNEHFYGAGHGLPLSTLDITHRTGYYEPRWEQKWLARVIDDKLFLSARHTLSFEGTEVEFESIIAEGERDICAHVGIRKYADKGQREHDERMHTSQQKFCNIQNVRLRIQGSATVVPCPSFNPSWSPSRTIHSFRRKNSASCLPGREALRECRDVLGSCIFCATDYVTTLEKRNVGEARERTPEEWVLTVTAYHDLGSFRSPSDPKWEAFRQTVFNHTRPERETLGSLPGEVKMRWEESV